MVKEFYIIRINKTYVVSKKIGVVLGKQVMLALKGYEQNEGFSVISTDEFHKARNI